MRDFEVNSADGTCLRGRDFEAPENPVAMMSLVHGFGEHGGRYAPMADYLRGQGVAVSAIDLRGHGRSDGARGACSDYSRFFEDVDALIAHSRARVPDVPHILFGHSMGGGLVLNYTLTRKPDDLSGVIAQAPLIFLAEAPPAPLEKLLKGISKFLPDAPLGNKLEADKISTLTEEQQKYVDDPLNHGRLTMGLAAGMVDGGRSVLARAGQWSLPLLLMHAKGDRLTSCAGSEAFAEVAPNCTFVPFEGVEHEIHNDKSRADVYERLYDFIKDLL